jgi:uncharacterized protein YhaN
MGDRYLKYLRIDSFGAFSGKTVGPFKPGLNVVFGRNEAGKTTVSQFVGGVLFGWEDARGRGKNTYKPANAERSGSLIFGENGYDPYDATGRLDASPDTPKTASADVAELRVSRGANVDGLQGDVEIVGDIDKETFRTMFLLTSDELRSLKNTQSITAHLLTAGSGTNVSPAQVLSQVDEHIQMFQSRAESSTESLVRLNAQLAEARERVRMAREETERYKEEDCEYRELARQREGMVARIAQLNESISLLTSQRAELQGILDSEEAAAQRLSEANEQARRARIMLEGASVAGSCRDANESRPCLDGLDANAERVLREKLDDLADEQVRFEHSVDDARDRCADSQAAYEALTDQRKDGVGFGRGGSGVTRIAASVLLPAIFAALGVFLFARGIESESFPFAAAGAGLLVAAIAIAVGALLAVGRPGKGNDGFERRLADAQLAAARDAKKLEQVSAQRDEFMARVERELAQSGLAEAGGSVRLARAILDDASQARSDRALASRHMADAKVRIETEESVMDELGARKERLAAAIMRAHPEVDFSAGADFEASGIPDAAIGRPSQPARASLQLGRSSLVAIDAVISRESAKRDDLVASMENMSLRYGELGEQLARAKDMHAYDRAKQDYHQIKTRIADSKNQLTKLLIERRLLQKAIETWESQSQPKVYAQASELLSLMTGGAWVRISLSPKGHLLATDAVQNQREPRHLSLGTCQQMYLALRIALLLCADNVGAAIPVLADDILVNFDSKRRAGAVKALALLARKRQVILFTCHEEVVEAVSLADPACTHVEL